MADDLKKRAPQDASRINVHEPWEVKYWTHKFGVTKDALAAAVELVGTSAQAVADQVKSKNEEQDCKARKNSQMEGAQDVVEALAHHPAPCRCGWG